MADFLESDVQDNGRIVYFEPNDLQIYDMRGEGLSYDDLTDNTVFGNEKLSLSVDLQVIVPDRLESSTDGSKVYQYNIANEGDKKSNWISLMNGTPITIENPVFNEQGGNTVFNEMTTDYTVASYHEVKKNGSGGYENLGIKSINISFEPNYYPIVNIKFVDVRSFSLMMPCDDDYIETVKNKGLKGDGFGSFYKSLFNMPYPRFLLTIRGYYGKPVTFELTLSKFIAGFDDKTGDTNIDVQFIGCVYGLYSDLPFNVLLVAPYLDYMNNSNKSVLKKNDRWKNENFTYAGDNGKSSGKHILTYLEYMKVFSEMSEKLKDSQTEEINKYTKGMEALGTLSSESLKLIGDIKYLVENISRSENLHRIGDHNDDIIFYFLTRPTNLEKPTLDVDLIANFNKKMDHYTALLKSALKNHTVSGETGSININAFENVRIQEETEFKTFANVTTIEEFERRYSYDDVFTKERVGDILSMMACYENIRNNRKYFTVDTKKLSKLFSIVHEWCQSEYDKANKKRAELIDGDMIKVFGFKPTVRNIFRQLFAHIDCFMESFYQLLSDINKDIEGGKRKAGELFRSAYSDIKDDASYDKDVSPFPAVYKLEDNINTLMYPGEDRNLKDIREVRFVEDIIDTLFKTNNNINGMSSVSEKNANSQLFNMLSELNGVEVGGEEGTKETTPKNKEEDKSFPFTPTIPCDYLNGEENPYSRCNNLLDVVKTFGLRLGEMYYYEWHEKNVSKLISNEANMAANYTKNCSSIINMQYKTNDGELTNFSVFHRNAKIFDSFKRTVSKDYVKKFTDFLPKSPYRQIYTCMDGVYYRNMDYRLIYDYGKVDSPKLSVKSISGMNACLLISVLKCHEKFTPELFLKKFNKDTCHFYNKPNYSEYANKSDGVNFLCVKKLMDMFYNNDGTVKSKYKKEMLLKNVINVGNDKEFDKYIINEWYKAGGKVGELYKSYYVSPINKKFANKRDFYKYLSSVYVGDKFYNTMKGDEKFANFASGWSPGYAKFSVLGLYRMIDGLSESDAEKRYPVIMEAIRKFEATKESDSFMSLFLKYDTKHERFKKKMNLGDLSDLYKLCQEEDNMKRVEFMKMSVHVYSMRPYYDRSMYGVKKFKINNKFIESFIQQYFDCFANNIKGGK